MESSNSPSPCAHTYIHAHTYAPTYLYTPSPERIFLASAYLPERCTPLITNLLVSTKLFIKRVYHGESRYAEINREEGQQWQQQCLCVCVRETERERDGKGKAKDETSGIHTMENISFQLNIFGQTIVLSLLKWHLLHYPLSYPLLLFIP